MQRSHTCIDVNTRDHMSANINSSCRATKYLDSDLVIGQHHHHVHVFYFASIIQPLNNIHLFGRAFVFAVSFRFTYFAASKSIKSD